MSIQAISNFHTHTQLCKHAVGMPIDYVRMAKEQGCTELGFSDHCPYPDVLGPQWDDCRMSVSQIEFYINSVKEAAKEADFPVHVGFECEFDPKYLSWYKDELLGHYGAEYLVFGPHWVKESDSDRPYICAVKPDTRILHKYTDLIIEGLQTGIYSILAHPDLMMTAWREWDDEIASCFKAVIDCAEDMSVPVEVNGLGIHRGIIKTSRGERYNYPYDEFWQLVAESNVKVICDSDAHQCEHVIANARRSREFASKFGLTPIETIF